MFKFVQSVLVLFKIFCFYTMLCSFQLSEVKKQKIIDLKNCGKRQQQIAGITNRSQCVVKNFLKFGIKSYGKNKRSGRLSRFFFLKFMINHIYLLVISDRWVLFLSFQDFLSFKWDRWFQLLLAHIIIIIAERKENHIAKSSGR